MVIKSACFLIPSLNKWFLLQLCPIECGVVNRISRRRSFSFKHVSLWCLFFDLDLIAHHSNIGVRLSTVTKHTHNLVHFGNRRNQFVVHRKVHSEYPLWRMQTQVFTRERLNGHYGVGAFVVGNTLSSIPFLFLIASVSTSIFYFMVGLHPGIERFIYFVLSLFACLLVVESLMMAVAALVPNYLMGIITGAGIQVWTKN